MKFTEEQVQDMVSLKEHLVEQIDQHQKSIDMLEKNLAILDTILKQSSFTKASACKQTAASNIRKQKRKFQSPKVVAAIAKAYVTPEQVSIILDEKIGVDPEIPPFKSFFLDRIIGEMKRKDSAEADNGKIQKESIIDYVINKNGSNIREIIIKNYRQKERVNEIINTAGWSLTRMLENTNK